jgi:Xaa-Pro aminopeptidase
VPALPVPERATSHEPGQAVVIAGDPLTQPDLRHALPVLVPDPLIYLEANGTRTVVVSRLDAPLFEEVDGVELVTFDEIRDEDASPKAAANWFALLADLAVRACRDREVREARVPARFPHAVARALAAAGIEVEPDEPLFVDRRRVKTEAEVAAMRTAVAAAEAGWDAVRAALRERPGVTSEELHLAVLAAFAQFDVVPYDILIVPHGGQSAVGHAGGRGPIQPGEPVIADLIVRDRATGVYADITRTFCVGEPPAELVEQFELCREALEAAIAAVRPGVLCEELNAVVSDIFEAGGYPTLRQLRRGDAYGRGFYHGLGHGVGLEVHEPPLLAAGSQVPLLEGEVLCIEPGVYRTGFGGCRLEDMVLVTADGHERLGAYEYSLTP